MLDAISHDVRHALRSLRRAPGLTIFALTMLTVGIGATAALFSLVDQVVFRSLPFRDPDRLVTLHEIVPRSETAKSPVNAAHFAEWRTARRSFEEMALLYPVSFTLTGTSEPERVGGARASAALFSMLGMPVLHGRGFSADEDTLGRDRVVVLGHDLWTRRFGADPAIVGQQIRLDGEPYTVVGVLAPGFEFLTVSHLYPMTIAAERPEIWKPLGVHPSELNPVRDFNFAGIARLRPQVSVEQALSELNTIQSDIGRRLPGSIDLKAAVVPLHEQIIGASRAGLELLLATAAVVLLVVCVNIANLFLTRGIARQQEIAIRQAAGASRRRLVQQFLAESLVLAAAGGLLGALVAPALIRLIVASAPVDLPRVADAALDSRVLLFTAALSLVCAVALGVLPAIRSSNVDPIAALKLSSRGVGRTTAGGRLGSFLVSLQVGASTTCLVVAGLLVASLTNVMSVDPGFDRDHVICGELRLPGTRYDAARASRFMLALKQKAEAIPGVVSAGISDRVPLSGEGGSRAIAPEGSNLPRMQRPVVSLQLADGGYFRALGIPILKGRVFDELDRQRTPVAVLSASAAARIWSGQDPIGKRFRAGADTSPLIEIVGIVGDVRGVTLEGPPRLNIYLPYWHVFVGQASLTVRTAGDPAVTVPALGAAIRQLDPEMAVPAFQSIEQIISRSVRTRRFQMELALILAATALVLACLGIYGTVSQSTRRRTHEIGIRIALGAKPRTIQWMVLLQGLTPVAIGLVGGFAVTLGLAPVLRGLLFGISPTDVTILALTAAVLGSVAAIAAYLPGHRAARVSPIVAMRADV